MTTRRASLVFSFRCACARPLRYLSVNLRNMISRACTHGQSPLVALRSLADNYSSLARYYSHPHTPLILWHSLPSTGRFREEGLPFESTLCHGRRTYFCLITEAQYEALSLRLSLCLFCPNRHLSPFRYSCGIWVLCSLCESSLAASTHVRADCIGSSRE